MSYHAAEYSRIKQGAERTRWHVATQYHKTDTPHESTAYTQASEDHKILRWESNNSVVPGDIMEVATGLFGEHWPFRAEMDVVRDVETVASIAQYIEARANISDEQRAEEDFERRAAFGEGEEVVNIITGERYRT